MTWRRFNRDLTGRNIQRWRNGVGIFDNVSNGVSIDLDAQAIIDFYTSLGATPSSADQVTISNWVKGRKAVGQYGQGWTGAGSKLIRGFWEFLGGSASTHRVNWADPQDSNAALRLQFFGGFTHTAGLIQGDSITNYVRCYLSDSGLSSVSERQFGAYPRTNSSPSAQVDMGRGTSQIARLQARDSGGLCKVEHYGPQRTAAVADSLGPYTVYRDATKVYAIKGSSVIIDALATIGSPVASEYLLTCTNNTDSAAITPAFRSGRAYSSFWAFENFTEADIIDFHSSVVQLETDLGK